MRAIVLSLGITLDGYIARRDGSVDYLFLPKDYSMAEFFASIDTVLMGRKTFDTVRAMGSPMGNGTANYVFSRTEPTGERDGAVFVNESIGGFVRRLRRSSGKDIWLMGGGELARDFLKEDLVDELHLGIVPILLGEGIPMFPSGYPQRDFTLVESGSYSKGLVVVKYKRARGKGKRQG